MRKVVTIRCCTKTPETLVISGVFVQQRGVSSVQRVAGNESSIHRIPREDTARRIVVEESQSSVRAVSSTSSRKRATVERVLSPWPSYPNDGGVGIGVGPAYSPHNHHIPSSGLAATSPAFHCGGTGTPVAQVQETVGERGPEMRASIARNRRRGQGRAGAPRGGGAAVPPEGEESKNAKSVFRPPCTVAHENAANDPDTLAALARMERNYPRGRTRKFTLQAEAAGVRGFERTSFSADDSKRPSEETRRDHVKGQGALGKQHHSVAENNYRKSRLDYLARKREYRAQLLDRVIKNKKPPGIHDPPVIRRPGDIVQASYIVRNSWSCPAVGFNSILQIPIHKFEVWKEEDEEDDGAPESSLFGEVPTTGTSEGSSQGAAPNNVLGTTVFGTSAGQQKEVGPPPSVAVRFHNHLIANTGLIISRDVHNVLGEVIVPNDIFGKPLRKDLIYRAYWFYRHSLAG